MVTVHGDAGGNLIYGDAAGSLLGHTRGSDDGFIANDSEYNSYLDGDAGGDMADRAAGGNDSFAD